MCFVKNDSEFSLFCWIVVNWTEFLLSWSEWWSWSWSFFPLLFLMPAVSNWVLSLFSRFRPLQPYASRFRVSAPVLMMTRDAMERFGIVSALIYWLCFCCALNCKFISACEPKFAGKKNKKQKTTSANQRSCAFNSVSGVQCLVFCICTSLFCLSLAMSLKFVCVFECDCCPDLILTDCSEQWSMMLRQIRAAIEKIEK